MPIAITEWGIQTFDQPAAADGFASRRDGQAFLVKSAFYLLAQQRVSMAVLHQLGYNDPWCLVNKRADGTLAYTPLFATYQWLCHTFNGNSYRVLPAKVDPADDVRAYAILLTDSGVVYLACWQGRFDSATQRAAALPARTVQVAVPGLPPGRYSQNQLDMVGHGQAAERCEAKSGLTIQVTLSADGMTAESEPLVYRYEPTR
jgi:hypothetical protein